MCVSIWGPGAMQIDLHRGRGCEAVRIIRRIFLPLATGCCLYAGRGYPMKFGVVWRSLLGTEGGDFGVLGVDDVALYWPLVYEGKYCRAGWYPFMLFLCNFVLAFTCRLCLSGDGWLVVGVLCV